jgi:hypothetical protein
MWQIDLFFVFFSFFYCSVVVHCDIYKSSYNVSNISYLNLPPTSCSFILCPPFLEYFLQVSFFHLHTCVHSICTVFTLLHIFPTSHTCHSPDSKPSDSYSLIFIKKKKKSLLIVEESYIENILVTFLYIFVL